MLIKIANAPYFEGSNKNSFTIFDNVSTILSCKTSPTEHTSNEDLLFFLNLPHGQEDIVIEIFNYDAISFLEGLEMYKTCPLMDTNKPTNEHLSENKIYLTNSIIFERGGKRHIARFDTMAYICNDEGKTLEKCFAGGILHKS